ncbi:MAG: translation initiation factor IF-2, partial [Alphaproteobacteria bacterium]|nr:translation initiation factor IF-2 [Alphaproteobacteria bacterium]
VTKVAVSAELAAKAGARPADEEEEERPRKAVAAKGAPQPKRPVATPRAEPRRRAGKITVTQALDEPEQDRVRSLASMRRARERERLRQMQRGQEKVIREVIIPDAITVQELASRMAERGGDVIKSLMRQGIMATINHVLDADTAELIVTDFGHTPKRQSESDVELGLVGGPDEDTLLQPRAPVVTIMGHVDHGKTSLLDALRNADVAAHEAGGITQHIGAYRVRLASGETITFIDTPGHEAFTEMRARGANVTDIVVLVVAADDGVMPQTIEAIKHAKAAQVPIIVAVNKCDKPDARPDRVKTELLSHEIVVEDMGGDVQAVEVSAKTGDGLDRLKEAILLQAEVLELRANPDRSAEGRVIEAQLDRGRGAVATVLVQRGTLHTGDIFVAGAEWGRVRALVDERGNQLKEAGPGVPVEVLGLQGVPVAGDDFIVVENETRARDVTEFRQRKKREQELKAATRSTVAEMIGRIQAGEAKELPIVVKSDVHGSLEAIVASILKMGTEEVVPRLLHSGVGAISESDVTLAKASNALIIAFNVRANAQARDMAKRDGIDIRYYSVIYNVVDDVKAALSGLLSPEQRENFLGYAEIRAIFDITKVGKVAGCRVTEGMVKRGAKVRLLRDNVVIHEGTLKTLRRFKDEVREVQQGFECGMAFENYSDIREGDVIECFEIVESARTL